MHILVICLPCCEYLLVLPCTYVVYVLILRAIIFLIIGGTNIHNLLHFSLITKLVSITIVKRSFSIHHLYYICNHHIHGSSFWGTSNGLLEKRIYYSIQKLAFALGPIGPGLWLQNLSF